MVMKLGDCDSLIHLLEEDCVDLAADGDDSTVAVDLRELRRGAMVELVVRESCGRQVVALGCGCVIDERQHKDRPEGENAKSNNREWQVAGK